MYLPDKFLTMMFFAPIARIISARFSTNPAIPILMYHSVSNEPDTETHPYFWLNTTPALFEAQMRFLGDNHYEVISLSRAVDILQENIKTNNKRQSYVVITFDDGFRDFYLNAFPILQKFGFTATVFLPTDYITDRTKKMDNKEHMSWEEISGLMKQGITFGSHTARHPQLKNLKRDEVNFEISHSKQVIESKLGVPVESFSYPFAFPEEDKELTQYLTDTLMSCGYKYGVSTRIGRATVHEPIFFLKRLPVNSRDDLAFFKAKLDGGYDWLYWIQLASKIIGEKLRSGKKQN